MQTKELKLSGDRKVSPRSRWSIVKKTGKSVAKVKVHNAFGLPAMDSCPDFTEWCRKVCYAFNLQRLYTAVDALVRQNLEILQACGSNVSKMVELLVTMVESVKWGDAPRVFRWHWDGDVFSLPYAHAIAETARRTPDVQHWLYTRSFGFVGALVGIPNLTVYLSVDAFNAEEAKRTLALYPTLLVAACADTWDESETLMRSLVGRNAPRCPELTHKIPLVTESGEGACVACGLCIYGRNHVRFASSH